jgi:hypothetical protein
LTSWENSAFQVQVAWLIICRDCQEVYQLLQCERLDEKSTGAISFRPQAIFIRAGSRNDHDRNIVSVFPDLMFKEIQPIAIGQLEVQAKCTNCRPPEGQAQSRSCANGLGRYAALLETARDTFGEEHVVFCYQYRQFRSPVAAGWASHIKNRASSGRISLIATY